MDNNLVEPNFERLPSSGREVPEDNDFEKKFAKEGVPPFAGEDFGAISQNEGTSDVAVNKPDGEVADVAAGEDENNDGITEAAAIINYGLNAAARDRGVEPVVQGLKNFVITASSDVIGDLFRQLGIDTPAEKKELNEEARATKISEGEFRAEQGVQSRGRYTNEGAIAAINNMKELISEVEGADPRFGALRQGARAANMGYFEYAVKDYAVRDLTTLFKVLSEQKEKGANNEGEMKGTGQEAEELEKIDAVQLNPKILKFPENGQVDFGNENRKVA